MDGRYSAVRHGTYDGLDHHGDRAEARRARPRHPWPRARPPCALREWDRGVGTRPVATAPGRRSPRPPLHPPAAPRSAIRSNSATTTGSCSARCTTPRRWSPPLPPASPCHHVTAEAASTSPPVPTMSPLDWQSTPPPSPSPTHPQPSSPPPHLFNPTPTTTPLRPLPSPLTNPPLTPDHTCATRTDGTAACSRSSVVDSWNDTIPLPPLPLSPARRRSPVATRIDGSVACWGHRLSPSPSPASQRHRASPHLRPLDAPRRWGAAKGSQRPTSGSTPLSPCSSGAEPAGFGVATAHDEQVGALRLSPLALRSNSVSRAVGAQRGPHGDHRNG